MPVRARPNFRDEAVAQELSERRADVFRTAQAGDVLTDEVFLDGNPPLWRFQLQGRDTFELTVYCSGAWDADLRAGHAAETQLIRP